MKKSTLKTGGIVTVVGARPNFIKIDPLLPQTIIHTGQHYDYNMSQGFFKELKLPKPAYNLNCRHIGQMVDKLQVLFKKLQPKLILVYGDTNSTLAGALAGVYQHIPIAHVEAGLRCGDNEAPEEINRKLVDQIATFRFCPTIEAVQNLFNEGIRENTFMVGDVMFDAMSKFMPLKATKNAGKYILLTVHRQENKNKANIVSILNGVVPAAYPVIFPVHPSIRKLVKLIQRFHPEFMRNIKVIDPVGYKQMLTLISNAKHVVTDSGGVSREAYWMQKPVTILRTHYEFSDIINSGYGVLAGTDPQKITQHISTFSRKGKDQIIPDYGAAKKIRQLLQHYA